MHEIYNFILIIIISFYNEHAPSMVCLTACVDGVWVSENLFLDC